MKKRRGREGEDEERGERWRGEGGKRVRDGWKSERGEGVMRKGGNGEKGERVMKEGRE